MKKSNHLNTKSMLKHRFSTSLKNNTTMLLFLVPFTACKEVNTGNPVKTAGVDLHDPVKKEIAMVLVSSAENSSPYWKDQYKYIEDIGDGRGYTAGIIGFTSGTGDMLRVVTSYSNHVPQNILAQYIPALQAVLGTSSHQGLDPGFTDAWISAANDVRFQAEQDAERDNTYFNPAVSLAKQDGLNALGQFIYYDAAVVHGYEGLESIRDEALAISNPPSNGGTEESYLNVFLDKRVIEMQKEAAHKDVSRIEGAQRVFLRNRNFDLNTPLSWVIYGDPYNIP